MGRVDQHAANCFVKCTTAKAPFRPVPLHRKVFLPGALARFTNAWVDPLATGCGSGLCTMPVQPSVPHQPAPHSAPCKPTVPFRQGGCRPIYPGPLRPRTWWRPTAISALLALMLAALLVTATVDIQPTGAALPAARPATAGEWNWPLIPEPGVVRSFDKPGQRWLAGHRGVDLSASAGDAVHSPADGTVRFTGYVVDRHVLTVDHGDGTVSSFEPVMATVHAGELVTAGEAIGVLAPGGSVPGGGLAESSAPERTQPHCPSSCLHWGVRLNGEYVDPLRYVLDRRPSVLLPLAGGPDG